jgi:transcriptional regulator with XRE-family HTH domain
MMGTSEELGGADLATAIRAYRYANRVTQTDFAARLGVTQQTVARWERGLAPRPDLTARIRAEIDQSAGPSSIAEIFPLPRADGRDDPRAELRERFVAACIKKMERGDPLPEAVLNFVVEQLGSSE